MSRSVHPWVGVAFALLALAGLAPAGEAELLARTFPSHLPQLQVEWQQGIGLFSPTTVDSCVAVLGGRTDGAQAVYYQSNRIYTLLVANDVPFTGASSGPLPGPIGDCFGALPPTIEIGMSDGELRADVFIALSALVGTTQFALAPTVAWTLVPCDFGSIAIVSAANPIYPATGVGLICFATGPPVNVSGEAEVLLGGGIGTEFAQPSVSSVGTGNRIICSSLTADLFDALTGLTTTESAHDWFTVFESVPNSAELAWAVTFDNVYNLEGDNGPCV